MVSISRCARRDDLAVDDGTPGADVPGVCGDLPEPVGSAVTTSCEYLDSLAGEVTWTR